jgi:hypothetical protein
MAAHYCCVARKTFERGPPPPRGDVGGLFCPLVDADWGIMDQLATHSTGHLFGWDLNNKPTIASSTRFEGHNYLTAVYVRIIFLPLLFAWA